MADGDPRDRFVMKPGDIVWDGGPDCAGHRDQLEEIRRIIKAERATEDLRRYLTTYSGARFDGMVDREHPDVFTDRDFRAVQQLSVSILLSARSWLRGEGLETVRNLLGSVPADRDVWEVQPQEYDSVLGRESAAWRLWEILADLQDGAGHSGKYVTAGKALHGKRPRLIPIYDRERIGAIPGITQQNIWEVMWCALRDDEIRERLVLLRAYVSATAELSLLRVLDIVIWMSQESWP